MAVNAQRMANAHVLHVQLAFNLKKNMYEILPDILMWPLLLCYCSAAALLLLLQWSMQCNARQCTGNTLSLTVPLLFLVQNKHGANRLSPCEKLTNTSLS
jgi:hypothetical protein